MANVLGLFLLISLAGVPSAGKWQRQVYTAKGSFVDFSVPKPLDYFTNDPFLRDDGNEYCISCTPAEKATIHLKMKSKAKVRFVGKIKDHSIYDVFYYFGREMIHWKSILVESAPGQFREIYHLQSPQEMTIGPSFIFNSGVELLLGTRDSIPGTGAFYCEAYWWFDRDGPILIDTTPIDAAITSILPKDAYISKGYGLDFRSLNYATDVWKEGDPNCCPTGGKISIDFKVVTGEAVITGKRYTPPAGK